jgi:hypothetical protein
MKYLIAMAAFVTLLALPAVMAQSKRIALTEKSTLPTAVLASGMDKKCSGVTLTTDVSKADYLLEAASTERLDDGTTATRAQFTLFSPSGDVLFHTTTRLYKNAMKDVCKFIGNAKWALVRSLALPFITVQSPPL